MRGGVGMEGKGAGGKGDIEEPGRKGDRGGGTKEGGK